MAAAWGSTANACICHFRSGDKDGGHSIGSAIPEKAINSNLMALPTLANNQGDQLGL